MTARMRWSVSRRCCLESTKGAAMKVFCVNTAAAFAGLSECISARSSAPPGLIPAATAVILKPCTIICIRTLMIDPNVPAEGPDDGDTAPIGGIRAILRLHLRSEEHTSELQSLRHLVCRLLL